jgi:hypothetical protein
MLDPVQIIKASAAAAVLAALVWLLLGGARRQPHPERAAAGGALSVGAAILVGAWLLGLAPHFPPPEGVDRFLLILLPAAVGAELAAAALRRRAAWLAWASRLVVASGAARVLLHGSTYITDSAGAGTREWPPAETWLVLSTLAAALAAGWALLNRQAVRNTGRSTLLTLSVAAAAAGVVVMLSGYASGGQLGFPLAAALAAMAVVSVAAPERPDLRGAIGVGIVGLFALLVIGRFFGNLSTSNALVLFCTPLLPWLAELAPATRLGTRWRGFGRAMLALVPIAVVLTLAVQKFNADSRRPAATVAPNTPSIEDYLNFGK